MKTVKKSNYKKVPREKRRIYQSRCIKKKLAKEPWYRLFISLCVKCYGVTSSYAKRGIKNYLSPEDVKMMWFRDKAYLMEKASIDRIDGNGDYTLDNTRMMELDENIKRGAEDHRIEMVGEMCGLLFVLRESHRDRGVHWLCVCTCGRQKIVDGAYLRNGTVRSCGCMKGRKI